MARYVGASFAGPRDYLGHRRLRAALLGIWVMRDTPARALGRLAGGVYLSDFPSPSGGRPATLSEQPAQVLGGRRGATILQSDPATIRRGRV